MSETKVMTIVGTRPELIRLSRIIPLLDKYCDHTFVHTSQNYDKNLKDVFFKDLEIRDPDYTGRWWKGDNPSISQDINNILSTCEEAIRDVQPDKLLILGDTNSGLSAIIAKRFGIKVYHMEAGNRCFNDHVPEEVNRRIIDSCSDIFMPYTERSRQNLLQEGYASKKIFVTGNPIYEVLNYYSSKINNSSIMNELDLQPHKYFLVTIHRSENVDNDFVLYNLLTSISNLARHHKEDKFIISMHPHTMSKINPENKNEFCKMAAQALSEPNIIVKEPFGFFDFVKLETSATCVISDSGTVQEECCIYGVPNVTVRTTTERPETLECGSNILVGSKYKDIAKGVEIVIGDKSVNDSPPEYLKTNVSNTVLKLILGV